MLACSKSLKLFRIKSGGRGDMTGQRIIISKDDHASFVVVESGSSL
jgi:hypothetical protein